MSNVKGLPGYVECQPYDKKQFGTVAGIVSNLAISPRHKMASFFLNSQKVEMRTNQVPAWLKDGARIEIEIAEQNTIRLITPAKA